MSIGHLMLENKEDFIEKYSQFYLKSEDYENNRVKRKKQLGVNAKRFVPTDKEVETFVSDALDSFRKNEGNIDKKFIAWKAGRLTKDILDGINEYDDRNGRGKKIIHLDEYIEAINKRINDIRKEIKKCEVNKVYDILNELNEKCKVEQLGSVYMLTLLYFLSGRKYPIYDKFAHVAAKSLYFNKNPKDVYVGAIPGKDDETSMVMAVYGEYCWLLKKLFGTYDIERKLDQALWVYGHCTVKYKDGNIEDSIRNTYDEWVNT